MTAPLDPVAGAVAGAGDQVRPAEALVRQWNIPESDRLALITWGLPGHRQGGMRPRFQEEAAPTLVPNVAGPLERRLISSEQRLYKLSGTKSNAGSALSQGQGACCWSVRSR